jgi:hypothetical protein
MAGGHQRSHSEDQLLTTVKSQVQNPHPGKENVDACNSSPGRFVDNWEVNFWLARENEAAGAADAAAWVMLAVVIFGSGKVGVTRRCPCDPSTQNDAGRTPGSKITVHVLG